jgi:pimeloyl-ACP methyl ester carboxylesterase
MIHGGFCGGWYFEPLADRMTGKGWACMTPDLPLHGEGLKGEAAPAGLADQGIGDYTAAMADLVRSLDEPPVLIGHSLGGLVAQQLCAQGLAKAAVLLAPASPWGIAPTSPDEIAAITGLLSVGPFWTMVLDPVFEVAVGNSMDKLPGNDQRTAFDRLGAESGKALFQSMLWHLDLDRTAAVDETAVSCPMLCLTGVEDKVVAAGTVEAVADKYGANASYRAVPGFSHWIIGEPGWEVFADATESWLDSTLSRQ